MWVLTDSMLPRVANLVIHTDVYLNLLQQTKAVEQNSQASKNSDSNLNLLQKRSA